MQFPFLPRPEHPEDVAFVRSEINEVILGVEDMIYKLTRGRLYVGVSEDIVEDVMQRCREQLCFRSLPAYDVTRKTRLSTFTYTCINNHITQVKRDMARDANKHVGTVSHNMAASLRSPDTFHDHNVEAMAADIMANPGKYMTRKQADVFTKIVQNPDAMIKDLAKIMDYRQASSLSMMVKRIRERILEIGVEDGVRDN